MTTVSEVRVTDPQRYIDWVAWECNSCSLPSSESAFETVESLGISAHDYQVRISLRGTAAIRFRHAEDLALYLLSSNPESQVVK